MLQIVHANKRNMNVRMVQTAGATLNPEASQVGSKAGRRFNRQGSNSSMASRVSAASYASGLTGVPAMCKHVWDGASLCAQSGIITYTSARRDHSELAPLCYL